MEKQTYKPSNTATYGSKGSAVSAYQTQLNTQNAGKKGYVPLKVDGMYGPLTLAASQYKAPTVNLAVPSGSYESPETKAARDAQASYLNSLQEPNEDQIYKQTLGQFQAQIDAINAMYADEIARAKVQGTGRLGTQTAMSARRGLIGSDFGEANFQNQEADNNQVLKQIENEKMAKLSFLMGQAKTDASARLKAQREEFTKGLDARLAFYAEADSRKADNSSKAAKALIAQGLLLEDVPQTQLDQLAKYYGISSDDLKASYNDEKVASDALLKEKNKGFELSPGQSKYEFDPVSGGYKVVASAPVKTTTVKGKGTTTPKGTVVSGKATFTPDQLSAFSSELEKSRGTDRYVDPAVYLQAYQSWTDPEVGGLSKDFLLKYPPKQYVNPVNNTLPSYLRSTPEKLPSTKKTTTSTTSTPSGRTR